MSRVSVSSATGSTGSQGARLFTIHQVDTNTDNLPKAHTWYAVLQAFILVHSNHVFVCERLENNGELIEIADFVGCFSFNRIDVPPYESYDKFYDKMTCAVEETCGFNVE